MRCMESGLTCGDMHADRPGLLPVGYLKGVIEQNKEFMKMTVTGASS